jgi:ubiquinone/menaquinone biosynthesis C-methylase UbiE
MRLHDAPYVHGYHLHESARLEDQASVLEPLLHGDTRFEPGSRVLEVGCGTGAQTVSLACNSPGAQILAIDISAASIAEARKRVRQAGIQNITFLVADLLDPRLEQASFDDIFVCFVLEHLSEPRAVLRRLMSLLRPGGSIRVVEGDHGSVFFHPDNEAARACVAAQVKLQRLAGGDAKIGRSLYPLLSEAGFKELRVEPLMIYVDASRPELAHGFTHRTFTAMVEGIRHRALEAGLIDRATFDEGLRALGRAAGHEGVFCYTFFKAFGVRPSGLPTTDG